MKCVSRCLDTEELFYNIRSEKLFWRLVVAALLCWNAFFVILELSDTCLQSRKANQLMILNTIAYIS